MHSISGTVCLGPLGAPCVFHPQPQPAAVACLAQSLCAFQAQRALETWLYNLNPIEPDRWSPHAACCLLLLACCEPLTACCLLMVQGAPHPLTPGAGTKRCQPREAADQPMPRPRPPCLLPTPLTPALVVPVPVRTSASAKVRCQRRPLPFPTLGRFAVGAAS